MPASRPVRFLTLALLLIAPISLSPALAQSALDFDGTNAYVTFGDPSALDLGTFTIECWFRRDGTGVSASTGTGGISAVPLVTKGRGEADGNNRDMNWFFGIAGSVLGADFEEGAAGSSPGLNHPVTGSTTIVNGTWYHAAATYDGTTWKLYLNGVEDGSATVGQPPRSDSIQHAALASALTSTGSPSGYLDGVLDEVRVWDHARTGPEIQATMYQEIASATGLVARWGLEEGTGTSVADTSGSSVTGTVTGTGYAWTTGAPSLSGPPPDQPVLSAPADGATDLAIPVTLDVTVSDADSSSLDVTFYGREEAAPAENFTIVALPDTQYYSRDYPATFAAQTQWIVANRAARNIVYVAGLGDIVNDGNTQPSQWTNADAAISLLEDPNTTGLPEGIPHGLAVGNHDQTPAYDPGTLADDDATTGYYNSTFGSGRYAGLSWYGGHHGTAQDNHYELFSAAGMDFIVLHLEYDQTDNPLRTDVLGWAEGLLQAYSSRRAILISHYLINPSGATWSNQGQAVYDALKDNPNLFLMMCGHLDQANRRSDSYNGSTIHTLLSDYQTQAGGGNGWLRILTFRPSENRIDVETYSPTLDQYLTGSSNQFSLDYAMQAAPFSVIDTDTGVATGAHATAQWGGLSFGTTYEWYVEVSDGSSTTTGPVWSFTTGADCSNPAPDDPTCDGIDEDCDGFTDEDYASEPTSCGLGVCAAMGATSCVAGAVVDSCTPGTPVTGTSLDFNGSSGYVNLGHAAAISDFGASDLTVEAWFYARSAASYVSIFRHGRQGAASQVTIQMPGSSPYDRLTVSVEDTAGHQVDVTPVTFSLNQWHHAAAVVDRSANEIRMYIDGALAGTADGSAWGSNPIISADDVLLGVARLSAGTLANYLNGLVDEVRIWSVARTLPEIQDGMTREIVSAPGLVARWGLEEGSGTTAFDSVGTSHGALTGGVAWAMDSPLGPEQACNGIDEDCDGLADEDYLVDATCGVGACLAGNTPSSCAAGVETPCIPGAPAADDSACDAVDNDCDGATDEEYPGAVTSCGTGECADTGEDLCINGTPVDTCRPGAPAGDYALDLDGSGEYVTFGPASALGSTTFTLEAWIKRQGAGVAASTGSGGVLAIPILTKGRGEADGSNLDMNWFLGIRESDGVLAADFEDSATGGNHPVAGTTPVSMDTWHHVAATYDGTEWRLYLDGVLDGSLSVGSTPRADSIQHAAIGTALTSTGVAEGHFDGVIDEARVWSVALTQPELAAGMGGPLESGTGLAGRWGLDDGVGSVAVDSTAGATDGTLAGGTWVAGTPYAAYTEPPADHGLALDGAASHVALGQAPALGSAVFTLEAWFNWAGGGATSNTGTGGVLAYPLVTKGRGEADGSNLDMNWFLGIRGSDGVLAADFEDTASGLNHPVAGVTPVSQGRWHHAAAVYDGTAWSLYLDGTLETTFYAGATPRADSVQHAAIGTAMNSSGTPSGWFAGSIDEVRVWSVARTGNELRASMNEAVSSATGLVGRWGLDEGSGSTAADSAGVTDGTVVAASWVDGWPFASRLVAVDVVCDGLDEDCDGYSDEEYIPQPSTCGLGECAAAGSVVCDAGAPVDTCRPAAPVMEMCDQLDNDCDGMTDDGDPGGGDECGPGVPASCTYMVMQCTPAGMVCTPVTGAAPEAARDLAFQGAETLVWTESAGASEYTVYRGTITPAGWAYDHACLASPVPSSGQVDASEPVMGTAFYYLVGGRNACGESHLGRDWGGDVRPNTSPCP